MNDNHRRDIMVDRRDLDEAWGALQEPVRKPLHELEAEVAAYQRQPSWWREKWAALVDLVLFWGRPSRYDSWPR